jgi:hypothetical protein
MKSKILPISLFIIFFVFAAIQVNDPDPLLWIALYGVVAGCAVIRLWAPQLEFSIWLTGIQVGMLVYGLFLVPGFIEFLGQPDKIDLVGQMKAESPWIEETRELIGLLIAIFALNLLKKAEAKSQ